MVKRLLIIFPLLFHLSCDRLYDPQELEFDLPSVKLYIDPENIEILNSNIFSNRYVDGKFVYNNREYNVQLRYQGQASRRSFKKSYKIKFENTDLFENKKKIILKSQPFDPSLLRSRLSVHLFSKAGLSTFDNKFVTLFINDEYKGLYCLIEPIDEFFFINRGKSVGHFYKGQTGKVRFSFTGGYDVREGFEKKPTDDGNYSDLEYLINILDVTPLDQLKEKLEPILWVENYLNYLTVSILISNRDGFYSNLYLYNDPEVNRFEIIPWDLDLTFESDYITYTIYGWNNLSRRILEVEDYRTRYKNRLLELLNSEFSEEVMFPMIDSLSEYIKDSYENDPYLKAKGYNLEQEVESIKSFIQSRRAYLEEQLEDF